MKTKEINKGDTVVCVVPVVMSEALTKHKQYEVLDVDKNMVKIENDGMYQTYYFIDRFRRV